MATDAIPVVGAVIWRDGKILAAQRKKGTKLGGLWEFPGGKIEEGESARQALMREINEEFEASINIASEICEVIHHYDFATIQLTTFHCKLLNDHLILNDHDAVRWLEKHELESVNWAPADLPTIEHLLKEAE